MTPARQKGAPGESAHKYACLDLVRALAALQVVAFHLKSFLLYNPHVSGIGGALKRIFSSITSHGHEAVMIFFVMSGYLVGKHVYLAFNADRWSWADYAIKRLSRLFIVLIPALVLTAVWDQIGIRVYHGDVYAGIIPIHPSMERWEFHTSYPSPENAAVAYGFRTFLGNALFLQTILVPWFGTNGPLWSLANEFWYYVIFPLAFFATRKRYAPKWRLASAGTAVALCLLLPRDLVIYGAIWLFGFCVVLIEAHVPVPIKSKNLRIATIFSAFVMLFVIYSPKFLQSNTIVHDFAVGFSFAILLTFLIKMDIRSNLFKSSSKIMADFSYTLYLTHFPFLTLLCCAFFDNKPLPFTGMAIALYAGFFLLAILYAFCVYLLFERNTKSLQNMLLRRFAPGRRSHTFGSLGRAA